MATYSKFSDVQGLVGYWNAGEPGTVNTTGTVVTSVSAGEPGVAADAMTTLAGSNDTLLFDGVEKIDELPCLSNTAAGAPQHALEWGNESLALDMAVGLTFVMVYERSDVAGTRRVIYGESLGSNSVSLEVNTGNERVRIGSRSTDYTVAEVGKPIVMVLTWGTGGDARVYYYIDGALQVFDELPTQIRDPIDSFVWGGREQLGTAYTFRGKLGILSAYNRGVTDEEARGLVDLCNVWVTTGEAPVVAPPQTSTYFGPVLTTDPANSTLDWLWTQTPTDGTSWKSVDDATNPLSSIGIVHSYETVAIDGQSQVKNQLNIESAVTHGTVYFVCQAIANYQPSGIMSYQYTLVIEAAS